MKLLKQQRSPIDRLRLAGQGLSQLRLPQQPLERAVVALLIGARCSTSAVQLQVKLIAPNRQPRCQRLEFGQIAPQTAVVLGGRLRLLLPEPQLLQHLGGGAATVVAHSGQPQGRINSGRPVPGQAVALHRHGIAISADRSIHQGQQL